MLKKLIILLGLLGLTACAGSGSQISYLKTGEIAGTAGLAVAADKCAPLEGSKEWQSCVAHYDGLYTKNNGVIKRSYTPSGDAPKAVGRIEKCEIKAALNSNTGTWSYTSCE